MKFKNASAFERSSARCTDARLYTLRIKIGTNHDWRSVSSRIVELASGRTLCLLAGNFVDLDQWVVGWYTLCSSFQRDGPVMFGLLAG